MDIMCVSMLPDTYVHIWAWLVHRFADWELKITPYMMSPYTSSGKKIRFWDRDFTHLTVLFKLLQTNQYIQVHYSSLYVNPRPTIRMFRKTVHSQWQYFSFVLSATEVGHSTDHPLQTLLPHCRCYWVYQDRSQIGHWKHAAHAASAPPHAPSTQPDQVPAPELCVAERSSLRHAHHSTSETWAAQDQRSTVRLDGICT